MAIATFDGHALPAAPAPHRRHVILVGTILAIAAGTMLLGGLLAAYFGARDAVADAGGTWVDGTTFPNVALSMAYLTLAMSSLTAQWVVSAVKGGDRRQAYVALGVTLVLGVAFVNALTFCWAQVGAAVGDGAFADHMYAVTITHLLLVIGAHVLFVVMGFRVLGGQFGPRNAELVQAAAAFWHFAAIAGAVVWWSIWFLEGGP